MVNVDRVKKKLPSLLCRGDTSKPENNKVFMRNRYRLLQFQKRNARALPQVFANLKSLIRKVLAEDRTELTRRIPNLDTNKMRFATELNIAAFRQRQASVW
jgi:hypothetical protein